MGSDKQIQKGGDGAQQLQVENLTVYTGITEERARAIFAEQSVLARKEYTEDAYRIANERVAVFEERLMPRIIEVENALPSFSDPAFQLLLRHAQITAASTEREADYDLLTELLICHVQKGQDRKNRAGINRAVEIVGEIDNDALCALTVAHAYSRFFPITGNCSDGIRIINNMISKLMYQKLPYGSSWLDHLDVLGAIRLSPIGKMKKVNEYYSSQLDGYICAGIKLDSEDYEKAVSILEGAGINKEFLVTNVCLDGYCRLNVRNADAINDLGIVIGHQRIPISQGQKDAIKQVWDLYSNDGQLKNRAKEKFFEIWDSYEALRTFRQWWDSIQQLFSITQVGEVLAQTNAKRCDPTLPDLI